MTARLPARRSRALWPRPRLLPVAAATLASALLLLVTACGDDDTSAASDTESTTTSPRPTTTEASGSQASTVEREIQGLLHSYDDLIRRITANPEAAADPRNHLYDQLRALMAPDSEMSAAVVNALVAQGNRGVAQRAEGDNELPIERKVDGSVEAVSANEFKVPVCAHLNYGLFNSSGQQIERIDGRVEPADAMVVRADGGTLLIRRFESVDDRSRCEGSGR